jgi:membrane protein
MSFREMAVPHLHRHRHVVRRHRHAVIGSLPESVREFGRTIWDANVTGLSSMLAYNMLLGVIPLALVGLFVAGQVISSRPAEMAINRTLQDFFPGTTKHQLDDLLHQVASSTPTTGVLALVASLWLASSFWGALDTSFSRIYGCSSRPWLAQKRFGLVMVLVMVLLLLATVAVPTLQSLLKGGAEHLPLLLRHTHGVIYVGSLVFSLGVLFGCLTLIYARVPNLKVAWHAVWPGALAATIAIGLAAIAFPVYLSSISTIARFGTTVVFIIIVLGWFYVVALIILAGGVMNSVSLRHLHRDGSASSERSGSPESDQEG